MKKALLVIGHGSRSNSAQTIFSEMIDIVREKASGFNVVEGCHMELCKPSISETVDKLAENEITEITMVPYFLYDGIHIKEDIPKIVEELSNKYENINFKMGRPIGVEPVLADILVSRAAEVI